mgnify:CR=1 FL=1
MVKKGERGHTPSLSLSVFLVVDPHASQPHRQTDTNAEEEVVVHFVAEHGVGSPVDGWAVHCWCSHQTNHPPTHPEPGGKKQPHSLLLPR